MEQTFEQFMENLREAVSTLPENYQAFFDLSESNQACWREDFERGISAEESVAECVDDLLRSQ